SASSSLRFVNELRRSNQESRARVFQLKRSFLRGVERIQRGIDATEHRDRMKNHRVFQTVRAEDREHITFAESSLREARRDATHIVFEFAISQRFASRPVDESDFIFDLSSRTEDEVAERNFRNRDVGIWRAEDHIVAQASACEIEN